MHISQVITLLGEEWTTSFYKRQSHMSWLSKSLFKYHFASRCGRKHDSWMRHPSQCAGRWVCRFPRPSYLAPRWSCIWKSPIRHLAVSWSFSVETFSTSLKTKVLPTSISHQERTSLICNESLKKKDPGIFFLGVQPEEVIRNVRDVQDVYWNLKKEKIIVLKYVWHEKNSIVKNWKQLNVQQ